MGVVDSWFLVFGNLQQYYLQYNEIVGLLDHVGCTCNLQPSPPLLKSLLASTTLRNSSARCARPDTLCLASAASSSPSASLTASGHSSASLRVIAMGCGASQQPGLFKDIYTAFPQLNAYRPQFENLKLYAPEIGEVCP